MSQTRTQPPHDHVDRFIAQLEGIPDLDYEVEGIVERIAALNKRFRHELEKTLAEHELSLGDWQVLGKLMLVCVDSCSSPGELAGDLELSSGAMTSRLDRLENAGLIRRLPQPNDRRGVKVEITDRGRDAWTESTSAQARKEALVAAGLSKQEQKQLNVLLRKLLLSFDD